jgi:4-hydroxy-tetrahydrodipicolinate reductase
MSSGLGPVKKGLACGVYQEARGYCGGKQVVTLKFEAALGLKNPHDRVVVVGEPSLDLTWKGGVQGDIATSAIVVNSIASLLQASPGLHTMASIPLVSCTPGSVKKT